jgi:hypothetical protein
MGFIRRCVRYQASNSVLSLLRCLQTWEETIAHFLRTRSSGMVDEMWCLDFANHGDSAVLNERKLGGLCTSHCLLHFTTWLTLLRGVDWLDNTRDILNFLLHYVPLRPTCERLSVHLPPVSTEEVAHRELLGYKDRTLIGVGQSFGGGFM